MNDKLFELLSQSVSKSGIQKNTEELNRLEGNESNSNFKASTDFLLKVMQESGFEQVERITLPADGKTTYFDCIMPQAWDGLGRSFIRLEDESMTMEERMIADSDKDPFNAGIWGAPTPEGGVTCEVTDYRITGADAAALRGKLVLMDGYTQKQYRFISESGAAGVIISDSQGGEEYPDHCRWCNGIAFTGWYHTAEDKRIPIFSITPRRAEFLRKRLAQGSLTAHAEARSRIYDGEVYTLTGIIPGSSPEEITMIAHMYEPFLPDDSAGSAVICEIGRCLKSLIGQGKLPPLKKTLRIVLSMERYGFSQYFLDRERNSRTLTVFSFDSCCHFPGGKDLPRLKLRLSSIIQPSFLDFCLPYLIQTKLPELTFRLERGNLSDDTFCSDDWIGIPSLWPHSANMRYHHNSGPAFMAADWDQAADIVKIFGTVIAALATADADSFRKIAEKTQELAKADLAERIAVVKYDLKTGRLEDKRDAVEKIRFLAGKAAERLNSINRYCPGSVKPDDLKSLAAMADQAVAAIPPVSGEPELYGTRAKAAKLVVTRLVPGTLMSMAKVPYAERRRPPIEDLLYILLDGKRSLYQAMKIYEYENDMTFSEAQFAQIIDSLRYLEKYGYVSIREI